MDLLALGLVVPKCSSSRIETEKAPATSTSFVDVPGKETTSKTSQQQLTIDLAQRLMNAAKRVTTDQKDIFALPTFCNLAIDEEKALLFARTFLEASDQSTVARQNGAAARELRDELTMIMKREQEFKDTLQESRETLIEDTLKAVETGDESKFMELYRNAQHSFSLQQTESMENTVRMLDKVKQLRRAGILPDNVKDKASLSALCDSYGSRPFEHHPASRSTRNGSTLNDALKIGGFPIKSSLATDLQRYASGKPEKGYSFDVHKGFIALRNDELAALSANCVNIIDFATEKDMASKLKKLSTKLGSLRENSGDPLGVRLRGAMEKDCPETVIACLRRMSEKFDEIVSFDPAKIEQLGESLINLARGIDYAKEQAKESKIER
ncbi:hypothetical protein I302_102731 [Kwoniella bestiolae CBS 10118]|uniref:Uncharacterized protein n=1 Tax=Kwoniella bestiolae CBS 10118 TaxID=1296100 RepID=A0A1B9GG25_9TREE|nr:hypothetical protein I302_01424 [Kwoniella bestiolae CBS 10118]OCF29911.1 hypothetical protein I302_01424 [Kwoniella bestiolae CBS 10118]